MALSEILVALLMAQALPITPMRLSPQEIATNLLYGVPEMSRADCAALDLWECHKDEPTRSNDLSERWLQLDEDPELEAILVTEAKAEWSYAAYVFDEQKPGWNLVGAFLCRSNRCDINALVSVRRLTEDSPPLVLLQRDIGGAGTATIHVDGYELVAGRLRPAFEVTQFEDVPFGDAYTTTRRVLGSQKHLVIHSVRRERGQVVGLGCEVMKWDRARHQFVIDQGARIQFCDPKSGDPLPGKAHPVGAPFLR
ncbi:MAG: hypothetical protein JNN08_19925 [Bryobacterales bacterium]|nr:hypothetical protein [Bryobacterales bacterium]